MGLAANKIYQIDCIKGLSQIEPGSVDLVFADPPFNIGYKYDVYHDRRAAEEYIQWSEKWMRGVYDALKPDGTFWLAIGDEYAAELKVVAQRELGFTCRSWVIWYYTFGVNCVRGFSRSHTHLFHFVKNPKNFTFNSDDPAIRVPSARQLVYADTRANPKGRLPDNTWILRPQDLPEGFQPDQDTWYFPRVAGTFKEREGFHGCQMPEQLLGRIIRCCSNPQETVLDPFGGSGTTLTVAKKLDRRWMGFELSKDYVERIKSRLSESHAGDLLDGAADPLKSAPATFQESRQLKLPIVESLEVTSAKRTKQPKSVVAESVEVPPAKRAKQSNPPTESLEVSSAKRPKQPKSVVVESVDVLPTKKAKQSKPLIAESVDVPLPKKPKRTRLISEDYTQGIIEAYQATHNDYSVDYVLANAELNHAFLNACEKKGLAGGAVEWNQSLLRIRKTGKLPKIAGSTRVLTSAQMDLFSFASEVAMQRLSVDYQTTLDGILCDPAIAAQFDALAGMYSPGFSSFEYRWAALALRKRAKKARQMAEELSGEWSCRRLPARKSVADSNWKKFACAGVYLLSDSKNNWLYVGETEDLERRIDRIKNIPAWKECGAESITVIRNDDKRLEMRIGLQAVLVQKVRPKMNLGLLLSDCEAAA